MKKIYSTLFIIISSVIFSQSLVRKNADKYYNQLAYVDALEFYKSLASKKNVTDEDIRRTAMCYYNIFDYENANSYLNQLSQKFPNSITESDLLAQLQVLKYLKKYSEVDNVLDKIKLKNNNNLLANSHFKRPNYYKELKDDSLNYKLTNIEQINTEYSEFSPVFFKNNSYLTFASNRKSTAMASKKFAWDNSYFIDLLNAKKIDSIHFRDILSLPKAIVSQYHDGPMTLSADEKTMYLTRTNYLDKKVGKSTKKIVNLKLYILKRDSLTGAWGNIKNFEYNSDEYSLGHAAINREGNILYFVSDMPGGYGQTDIWKSELKNGKWQQPKNLGQAINSEGKEMFPYIFEDGTMFYSSDGKAGLGGLDLYFSPVHLDEYFEPQNLGYPINSNRDDFGVSLNSDLKTGYISSNRDGGKGKDDIYYFRSKEPILGSTISGIVYDDLTKTILTNAKVFLVNSDNTKILDSAIVDMDGKYSFTVLDTKKKYKIAVQEKINHYDKISSVPDLVTGDNNLNVYLLPKYKFICTVYDAKTKAALEGVKATITDIRTKNSKVYVTNKDGFFEDAFKNKRFHDTIIYKVKFEKQGYITTTQDYITVLNDDLVLKIEAVINTNLQKLEIGADVAKSIKINPIYFDLNKFNIRPDASKELDKIVNVMLENPSMVIELGSHTDCRSSKSYNMTLSDKRAKSSAAYIVSKGISKSRIYGKGYGESKLINNCECEGVKESSCTELEHQQNRRTEFLIIKF